MATTESLLGVGDGDAVRASEVMKCWPYKLGRFCLTEDGHILESFFDWPACQEPRRLEECQSRPGYLDIVWDEFFEGDEDGKKFQRFECHVSRIVAYALTREVLERYRNSLLKQGREK